MPSVVIPFGGMGRIPGNSDTPPPPSGNPNTASPPSSPVAGRRAMNSIFNEAMQEEGAIMRSINDL
jgi:hypothetical protein